MDLVPLSLSVVSLLLALAALVVAVWTSRRAGVATLRSDVDELLEFTEKVARDVRSQRMRAVRQASRADSPPPELDLSVNPPASPLDPQSRKKALRIRARQIGVMH